jgi:ApaG protein
MQNHEKDTNSIEQDVEELALEIEDLEEYTLGEKSPMYVQSTITYLDKKSKDGEYNFAYKISVENIGEIPAQLIARHWVINDGETETYEVRGLGVVGEQPVIHPNNHYEYTSSVILTHTTGTMRGRYLFATEAGDVFHIEVPEFALAIPYALH